MDTERRETLRKQIDARGYAILSHVLDDGLLNALEEAFGQREGCVTRPGTEQNSAYPLRPFRNLMERVPYVRQVAHCLADQIVIPLLGPGYAPVRAIYFNKSDRANWGVPWHQDLSIAVRCRREADGFGPWSVKEGIPHVQPPASILERMLTLRLHLDDCGAQNGPLLVLPGSHRKGKLSAEAIENTVREERSVVCEAPCGGAVLMRPLLLHASHRADLPDQRRVIHIEYAADPLPSGLEWYEATKKEKSECD